jgi:hypothetical protein
MPISGATSGAQAAESDVFNCGNGGLTKKAALHTTTFHKDEKEKEEQEEAA